MNKKKVVYVWDENLIQQSNRLPAVPDRATLIHELIKSYNVFQHLQVVKSKPATISEIKVFHSASFLQHLESLKEIDADYISTEHDEEYGIGYDCPPVSQMFDLVSAIAGGSITAAKCLTLGVTNVAINWCGGWHHARRDAAEGFCYVNDIVLAIEILKPKFAKVLYVDLDVHHGNGVQDAYYTSKSVFTLSLHKCEPGFYPGTGLIDDIGSHEGRGYSCNVPLHAGYSDKTMEYIFTKVWSSVYAHFQPDAIVVQCGADALAGDPNGGGNLTTNGYTSCLKMILDKRKPTLLLGGGGYNHQNTAKLWTSVTALVAKVELEEDIPEHDNWIKYGPDYVLHIEPTLARDMNTKEYLDKCIARIEDNLAETFDNTYMKKNFSTCKVNSNRKTVYNKVPSSSDSKGQRFENQENIYDFVE